jgi:hypothetical protein
MPQPHSAARNFPTIGKKFSNHWKKSENFFQSLENRIKIFPMVGKNGANFPTIGKKVSNHWKTFPGRREREEKREEGGTGAARQDGDKRWGMGGWEGRASARPRGKK